MEVNIYHKEFSKESVYRSICYKKIVSKKLFLSKSKKKVLEIIDNASCDKYAVFDKIKTIIDF